MSKTTSIIAAVLAVLVIGLAWAALARDGGQVDLGRIAIKGELDARQKENVAATIRGHGSGSPGIDEIRRLVADLEWVFEARVMRRWPDDVVIEIVKEVPIAWWNDDAFINAEGLVFTSPYVDLMSLPQLYGPEGTESEVMQHFQMLAKAISRIDQSIDTLSLEDRGSWNFETNEGIRVMLGKENIMDRVQRFLFVVERVGLAERMDDIEQIDVRYPNGLAVSWSEVPQGLALAGSRLIEESHSKNIKRETRL